MLTWNRITGARVRVKSCLSSTFGFIRISEAVNFHTASSKFFISLLEKFLAFAALAVVSTSSQNLVKSAFLSKLVADKIPATADVKDCRLIILNWNLKIKGKVVILAFLQSFVKYRNLKNRIWHHQRSWPNHIRFTQI